MSNQSEEQNMGSELWQSQMTEAPRLSLEYVRHQATKLDKDRRCELGMIYTMVGAGAIATVGLFLVQSTKASALISFMRVGMVLFFVLGAVYSLIQIRRRLRAVSRSDEEKVMTGLEVYRAELQRRRDYYSYMGSWSSLLPFAPGMIVMLLSFVMLDTLPNHTRRLGIVVLLVVISTWAGFVFARSKMREFQRELDALSSLEK